MASRKKRAKQPPKKHPFVFVITLVLIVIIGVSGLSAMSLYALAQTWLVDLPDINTVTNYNQEQKTRMYANDGTWLGEFFNRDRIPVESDQVTHYVFEAIIAVEDERFFEHDGVDYYGIVRAIYIDLTTNDLQGASTITMQLVRQTLLQDEATETTMKRKVREMVLAQQLEDIFTKEQILMMYLNAINFGDGCWGIQSAARHYYSKDASDLTLAEAALICGIPQSPEYNNPVNYPERAITRRNIVLERMYVNGYITEDEMNTAKQAELNLNLTKRNVDGIYRAPYITSYAKRELLNLLSSDMVFNMGLDVYTSIDLNYQQWAEEACAWRESTMEEGFEASLTCVDPTTGYILCMRGGKDYYADQFNTCWQMRRQAGSSFKMYALVAAIEHGYSPYMTVSTESPLYIGSWRVENYSGADMGVMSLAEATAKSSNTAYAKVVRTLGADAIVEVAHRMGITSNLDAVPSIVLGSQGVCTLEQASAFGTLATNGIYNKPTTIVKVVVRSTGEVIYSHEPTQQRALTESVAYAATSVLRGVVSYGTGTSAGINGRDIAGKTGTSNDWCDAWFIGYTPQLSTAVWVGYRDYPKFMSSNEGGVMSAPVWRRFMVEALYERPSLEFAWASAPSYRPNADFLTQAERDVVKKKTTDTDNDGFNDWEEEQAGTDPKDPNKYPGKVEDPTPPPFTPPTPPLNPGTGDPGTGDPGSGDPGNGGGGGDPGGGIGGGGGGGLVTPP